MTHQKHYPCISFTPRKLPEHSFHQYLSVPPTEIRNHQLFDMLSSAGNNGTCNCEADKALARKGGIYTHWGRSDCPKKLKSSGNSELTSLVYRG